MRNEVRFVKSGDQRLKFLVEADCGHFAWLSPGFTMCGPCQRLLTDALVATIAKGMRFEAR